VEEVAVGSKIDISGLVQTGIGLVTNFVAGLFKSKTKAILKDLDAKSNYAAALDQKNKSTLMIVLVMAGVLVLAVFFLFIRKRK
jgi:hypothetical protein